MLKAIKSFFYDEPTDDEITGAYANIVASFQAQLEAKDHEIAGLKDSIEQLKRALLDNINKEEENQDALDRNLAQELSENHPRSGRGHYEDSKSTWKQFCSAVIEEELAQDTTQIGECGLTEL